MTEPSMNISAEERGKALALVHAASIPALSSAHMDRIVDAVAAALHAHAEESRAGALREAKDAMVRAETWTDAYDAVLALAAEAEPGAQG